jgi:hypothetical protein
MRWLLVSLLAAHGSALPSCDAETEANCLGEDADMSSEGIASCLAALADKSEGCTTYLSMMECVHRNRKAFRLG